jgi:biopolymer transport protein ExbB
MYYGNTSAVDGQDSGGTYDVSQVAVFHLGEKEGSPRDSTAYGNHATVFTGKLGLPSVIGDGVQFNGASQMKIAGSASLNFTKGLTFSTWIRPNKTSGTSCIFSWDDGNQSVIIGLTESRAYCILSSGKGRTVTAQSTAVLKQNEWYNLAVTIEPNKQISLYINGVEEKTSSLKGSTPLPSSDIFIGAAAGGQDAFTGDLDEVQLSNSVRSADWIRLAFLSQGPDSTVTSIVEEESGGGGTESLTIHLIKVIVRTITLDGWLIIGFLALMGCASLFIFQQKIMTLRQTRRGNDTFSQSFRSMSHPLALLETDQDFSGSSLYKVYQAGCEELANLLENKDESSNQRNGLSKSDINGFRSAIEKEVMYESRKLSSGMVIMNMSVAGGPFLGLLGTVWGVMNTFANLAEMGEANIVAIAPGVASALACTLAGLLVAIPSLFASTYITSKIKDVNADMNVFIDDFILKLEGEQGEKS